MLDRHRARLCRDCLAPMARQSGHCWRCDAPSSLDATREPPTKSLRQSTEHVLTARARRRADGIRRDRRPAARTPAPRRPKANT